MLPISSRRFPPLAVALLALAASAAAAQVPGDTVLVQAGARYARGGLSRWLLGGHHRELWTLPVRAPVLDLDTFDGGLTLLRRGGGQQTLSLRLRGTSGREWVFRTVDKDPSTLLPESWRGTAVDRILEDQTSAGHPFAPPVVASLLTATGVLHATPQLVVLPRDARLGEGNAALAGLLGYLEERPVDDAPGFAGDTEIISTDRLLDRLESHADERVDAAAYLRARLVDLLLGDWDRHEDQWRWARRTDGGRVRWVPIPRDRDQAFARYDGTLLGAARQRAPQLTVFGPKYGSIVGLGWNARHLDRRLLGELDWRDWSAQVDTLRARLTDGALATAVGTLPAEVPAAHRRELEAALRARRDDLPDAARGLFDLLAEHAELHATDEAETVLLERDRDRATVRIVDPDGGTRVARAFTRDGTREVRLFLRGGADRVRVTGTGGPRLRILAGGGDDSVEVAHRGGIRLHDRDGALALARGRARVAPERWRPVTGDTAPRSWGSADGALPWVSFAPDIGLIVGAAYARDGFGFQRAPYQSRLSIRAGWAFGVSAPKLELRWLRVPERSNARLDLFARASGAELVRFFGIGNETRRLDDRTFYRTPYQEYLLQLGIGQQLSRHLAVRVAPELRLTRTDTTTDRFIAQSRPLGVGDFSRVALTAELRLDTRDAPGAPTRGVRLTLGGSVAPAALDVDATYGEAHAEAAGYATPFGPGTPTVALRVGGKRVWGRYPYMDAAYLGGSTHVRGLPEQRFAGDAAAWTGLELRQPVGRLRLVLPMTFGLVALAEAGRVFVEGERSDIWHAGAGGGFYLAPLGARAVLSATAASSDDGTGVYVRAGFAF